MIDAQDLNSWINFCEHVDAKIADFYRDNPSEESIKAAADAMLYAARNSPESEKICWEYAAKRLMEQTEGAMK